MPSLMPHFWTCLNVIMQSINDRQKITYGELADKLGLKLAKQEWSGLLDLIARKTMAEVGYDLTWNVVYARGPAKNLGRFFTNGGKAPGSTLLNPKDQKQIASYERALQEIYRYTYELQRLRTRTRW